MDNGRIMKIKISVSNEKIIPGHAAVLAFTIFTKLSGNLEESRVVSTMSEKLQAKC